VTAVVFAAAPRPQYSAAAASFSLNNKSDGRSEARVSRNIKQEKKKTLSISHLGLNGSSISTTPEH